MPDIRRAKRRRQTKTVLLQRGRNREAMKLLNKYAALRKLQVTEAVESHLLETLPASIERLELQVKGSVTPQSQG